MRTISLRFSAISLGCVYELPNLAQQFGFKMGKVVSIINGMYNVMSDSGQGPYNLYANQIGEVIIDTNELKNTLGFFINN